MLNGSMETAFGNDKMEDTSIRDRISLSSGEGFLRENLPTTDTDSVNGIYL